MEMNVSSTTSAYTSAAASYDGYEVDKDLATKIKEEAAKSAETKDRYAFRRVLQEQAAIFERSEVKVFSWSVLKRETITGINTLGADLFRGYEKSQGYGSRNHAIRELTSKSISEQAEFYKKAYADLYDEIERGYADGTRKKTIVDDNGNKRLATKEEELAALDKQYAEITRRLTAKRSREVDNELVAQGKKEAPKNIYGQKYDAMTAAYKVQPKPQPAASEDVKEFAKAVTSENKEELETKRLDFVNMLSQNMLDFSALFKQSYSQAQPGSFDMASFFANIAQKQ